MFNEGKQILFKIWSYSQKKTKEVFKNWNRNGWIRNSEDECEGDEEEERDCVPVVLGMDTSCFYKQPAFFSLKQCGKLGRKQQEF